MGVVDVVLTENDLAKAFNGSEGQGFKTSPEVEFETALTYFGEMQRKKERDQGTFDAEDALAARNVVEPLVREYVDRTPKIPWLEKRLNKHRPDNVPCQRLEMDNLELNHNWRDAEADVMAIPYAPPRSYIEKLPDRLYSNKDPVNKPDFLGPDINVEIVAFSFLCERGFRHLQSVGEHDLEYLNTITDMGMKFGESGDYSTFLARVMATWAIDSAIPGVDVRRVMQHVGSIEKLCESNTGLFEIPSVGSLSQIVRDVDDELKRIHKGLAEMASHNNKNLFGDYDLRSLDVFVNSRSVIDTCRWYIEHNPDLTKDELALLNETLSRGYSTYHSVVQTCGSESSQSILAQAHRDVSTLIAGNKVDVSSGGRDIAEIDITCEEDYLGAFMAVASYDTVSKEYQETMAWLPLDWHGGARSYFGSFEQNADSTLRQQLTLMAILYFRMPEWQRQKYKDLIQAEMQKKLVKATNASVNYHETKFLYVPTIDLPGKVRTEYAGAFDWGVGGQDVFGAQHLMPMMDLVVKHPEMIKKVSPRLEIRPGEKTIVGMVGLVDENGVFVPDVSDDGEEVETPKIFVDLIKKLNEIEANPDGEFAPATERRQLVEQFVRDRTAETSTKVLSFLEKRFNPPQLDVFPCLSAELPSDFVRNEWERRADHILIPHVPPLEYLLNPPPNLWSEEQELEAGIVSPITPFVARVIRDVLRDNYGGVNELEPLFNDPEKLIQLYYTWASDTRIEGRELWHELNSQPRLQQILKTGSIDFENDVFDSETESDIYLFMPSDLLQAASTCQAEVDTMLNEASTQIKKKLVVVYRPNEVEVNKIFNKVENVILVARWHLDHGVVDINDRKDLAMLNNALETAYLVRNTILQECHLPGTGTTISKTHHDLLALIAGYKVDSDYPWAGQDRFTSSLKNDYFDAFMAVANAREVASLHQNLFSESMYENGDRQMGARAMFGSFECQKDAIQQQLAMLTAIYHRMPLWQRNKYRHIIDSHFDALEREVSIGQIRRVEPEHRMYIPSASTGIEKEEWGSEVWKLGRSPRHMGKEVEYNHAEIVSWRFNLWKMQHLYPIVSGYSLPNKASKGLQIKDNGQHIYGYGAENCWIDDHGFLHPGYEARTPSKRKRVKKSAELVVFEEIRAELENRWLANLVEAPSVSVESRLGPEMAGKLKELLEMNPNNGSIENLGSLSFLLEQLLGRELTEGDSIYLEMLKSLGMLNREAMDISSLGEKEIRDMLAFVKTEQPKFEHMDESSLILLFLGAAGVAPRQELLEQTIKAYETSANILALEAVEAIESIVETKKSNIFERMGLVAKERIDKKSFLTRRDELRNYLAMRRQESKNYIPENDGEWREMQLGMVRYIVELVHGAKRYDSSADSTIATVLAAKKNGNLLARCSTNGQILTILLNLGVPEFRANLTHDYGPEGNLSLEEFLRHLVSAADSGAESHAYSSSNRTSLDRTNRIEVILADGESGKVRMVHPDMVRNRVAPEMKFGILADHLAGDGYGERKRVMQDCVSGGSSVAAEMALKSGQIDFAEMIDPDWHMLNRTIMLGEKSYGTERRAKALRRIMQMYPYYIAMAQKSDYSREKLMITLSSTIETGREVGNWGAAFFAANIMKNAGFLGNAANGQGGGYVSLLARRVAVMGSGRYETVLKQHTEFLTAADLEIIASAREEYLAELAALTRESKESRLKVEKELKRKKAEEDRKEFDFRLEKSKQIAIDISREESIRQKVDETRSGVPQGKLDKAEVSEVIIQKIEEIKKETIDPDRGEFDNSRFQLLKPEVQDLMLLAAVIGEDGNLLEGSRLDRRIREIQELIVKYAHDSSAFALGQSGVGLMKLGGADSELVKDFESLALKLNDRLSRAIERKRLPVDVADFNPRLVAEQMGRQGVQELLVRRGSAKQLRG